MSFNLSISGHHVGGGVVEGVKNDVHEVENFVRSKATEIVDEIKERFGLDVTASFTGSTGSGLEPTQMVGGDEGVPNPDGPDAMPTGAPGAPEADPQPVVEDGPDTEAAPSEAE